MLLMSAFHLMLGPEGERPKSYGGVHAFMSWDGLMRTKNEIFLEEDGIVVMMLSKFRKTIFLLLWKDRIFYSCFCAIIGFK